MEYNLDLVTADIMHKSAEDAYINYNWWRKDFENGRSAGRRFSELPVLQDYPRFRGFGADYSVFRGLKAEQIEELRKRLLSIRQPESVADLLAKIANLTGGTTRISMASKLLALWAPHKFPMWDELARAGLKSLHGRARGHCYSQTTAKHYEIFRDDFFHLYDQLAPELLQKTTEYQGKVDPKIFTYRILDNVLMSLA
jgi:hypothetical protein